MDVPARVLIVGGGIAGVSTAAALRSGGFTGDLTLVDGGEFPYDRPPLSKAFLAGTQDFKQIALQPPEWYGARSVRLCAQTRVVALRPSDGAVELSDGSLLRADRVVLATGGRAARPPIPGSASVRVYVLRTAEDADRLRLALVPGARVLVVGGGLIGAEVASTAHSLGCTVTLVDPVAPPLAGAVGSEVASWLHAIHESHGVTTLRAGVQSFDHRPGGIVAHLSDGHPAAEFDAVVLGVGMVPETTVAASAGLEVDLGIIVDATQTTSNPAVLAVGDPARTRLEGALLARTEHWEAAQHDGARAAASILGAPPPVQTAPWFWTDRYGLHVEAVGSLASADQQVVRGDFGTPPFVVFGLRDSRVVGAVAVDNSMATRAARRLIDRAVTVDPMRLADPGTDLRRQVRG